MSQRKKIKLNVRFKNGNVICAKSPGECVSCKEECEKMELYYYPFKGIAECFKNSEKKV